MPFNGSGQYSAPSSPGAFNPAISGQSATPSAWNTYLTDLQTSISLMICRDGQSTITDDIPFSGNKITELADATLRDDATAAGQVQDGSFIYAADSGTADLYAISPTPSIPAYAVGQLFRIKIAHTNLTTTPTLAVSGLTAGLIKLPNADPVLIGALVINGIFEVAVASVTAGTPVFHLQTAFSYVPNVLTTRGDLIGRNATVPVRIALGTSGQVLASNGTDAVWTNPTAFPAGVVAPYAGATAPTGWLLAFGQSLLRADYAALFAAIGTTFGAADGTHFTLPDLRGRVAAGVDNMGGSAANRLGSGATGGVTAAATLAAAGGEQSHAQVAGEIAAHTHGSVVTSGTSVADRGVSTGDAAAIASVTTGSSGSTGSGTAANVTQPTLVLNYIIST